MDPVLIVLKTNLLVYTMQLFGLIILYGGIHCCEMLRDAQERRRTHQTHGISQPTGYMPIT